MSLSAGSALDRIKPTNRPLSSGTIPSDMTNRPHLTNRLNSCYRAFTNLFRHCSGANQTMASRTVGENRHQQRSGRGIQVLLQRHPCSWCLRHDQVTFTEGRFEAVLHERPLSNSGSCSRSPDPSDGIISPRHSGCGVQHAQSGVRFARTEGSCGPTSAQEGCKCADAF